MTEASRKWTWADFVQRCRSRTVSGEIDVNPLVFRVLLPWFIFCALGLLIDTEGELLKFAERIVPLTSALPLIGFFGLLSYWSTPKWSQGIKFLVWKIVWPVVVGVCYAYMTIGAFYWFNALAGSQEAVLVHGPVIKMYDRVGGRYGGHGWYLYITFDHRVVVLDVPRQDYEQIRVGDEYAVKMKRGALGYFYRWSNSILY
ncbi:hypothetical protein [Sulfurirhabdus autotrophica]|uniref:hypothetical protein n=1 Tax=Sulfurirhabdus autotrophica TaxID=1706046 RepID=UPI000F60CB8D|nr:hypothetical protein [Sulfurirhabdus autotrophica]